MLLNTLNLPGYVSVVADVAGLDRKSTRLNSSHLVISYAVFCLKKKKNNKHSTLPSSPHPPIHPTSLTIPPRNNHPETAHRVSPIAPPCCLPEHLSYLYPLCRLP